MTQRMHASLALFLCRSVSCFLPFLHKSCIDEHILATPPLRFIFKKRYKKASLQTHLIKLNSSLTETPRPEMDVKKRRKKRDIQNAIGVYNHLISSGPNKRFQAIVQRQNTVNYCFFCSNCNENAFLLILVFILVQRSIFSQSFFSEFEHR